MPRYVNFVKEANQLRIILLENRQDLVDELAYHPEWDDDMRLEETIEYEICNGWSWIKIGALTSAPILTDDVIFDDEGDVVEIGAVYYYNEYAIKDPVEVLLEDGYVIFQKVM